MMLHPSTHAVLTKVVMLLAPYLKRWSFTRQPEQVKECKAGKLSGGGACHLPEVLVLHEAT
eukprot:scaffold177277_cov22-Tisochrysis_lutea.AAC.1